jgi:hypothetical protein
LKIDELSNNECSDVREVLVHGEMFDVDPTLSVEMTQSFNAKV